MALLEQIDKTKLTGRSEAFGCMSLIVVPVDILFSEGSYLHNLRNALDIWGFAIALGLLLGNIGDRLYKAKISSPTLVSHILSEIPVGLLLGFAMGVLPHLNGQHSSNNFSKYVILFLLPVGLGGIYGALEYYWKRKGSPD